MQKLVSEIKIASNLLKEKSIEELELIIQKVKSRSTKEPLENLLIDWFALTQEMSYRTIGLRHFDTQLLAGIILHEGKIVEMKTGEGKTLASTLAVALNALSKKGVHVVTVNDYLAERDQKLMGKIYKALGLSVGLVKSTSTTLEKQTSYSSDITYLTNSELVFDYLRDSSSYNLNEVVQTPFNFCIIDEIDSILIDEARTPLILSTSKSNNNKNKLYLAKKIASLLSRGSDFEIDEKRREINLTELGYKNIKEKLGKKTLYDTEDPWILEILNALKAQYVFRKNKDYIVLNNKILIVDEFTGRIMEDRRWSMGIHEAMEAKENVEIGGGTKTKTSITYQNFFTLYPKLAGMTGTAKTTEKEFQDIYNLEVVVLPTENPLIRKDLSDLVYQTELAKWKAVLNLSKDCFERGQPVLIGTATVDKSEFLSDLFKLSKIPHQILNARPENVKRESEIVAQAGEKYAITIATNMAGRGTDIILGGNPIFKVKKKMVELLLEKTKGVSDTDLLNHVEKIEKEYTDKIELLEKHILNLPYSLEESLISLQNLYEDLYTAYSTRWKAENKEVKELGGLFVLGTERHETRRIDNQLRGRSGRQGDPGASQFIISLEDELIKIFGGDNIKRWVEYLIQDKDVPLESNILTNSLEEAQKKVEVYNYDLRKNVFQYDDILNTQRKQLFSARKDMLCKNISHELFLRYTETTVDQLSLDETNSFELLEKQLDSYGSYKSSLTKKDLYCEAWIWNDLQFAIGNSYQLGFLKNTRLINILSILDFYWTEHIERMNYIKETISWRSYGQQNPLLEYNNEAFRSFNIMFNQIRSSMLYYFLNKKINI
jgi:preprotein translocase subunit SecA